MARDSTGKYTKPLPDVAGGTDIESTWANTSFADFETAFTESLDRNGRGGMLMPLKNVVGTVGAPSITFTDEQQSGLYRASSGDIRMSVLGTDVYRVTNANKFEIWTGTEFKPVVLDGQQGSVPDGSITGQILEWNEGTNAWTVQAPLVKVPTGTPTEVFLQWNDGLGQWEAVQAPDSNVQDGTATNQTLRWNGSKWIQTNLFLVDNTGLPTSTALAGSGVGVIEVDANGKFQRGASGNNVQDGNAVSQTLRWNGSQWIRNNTFIVSSTGQVTSGTWEADEIGAAYLPVGNQSQAGIVQRASQSEVDNGTQSSKYVTPQTARNSEWVTKHQGLGFTEAATILMDSTGGSNFAVAKVLNGANTEYTITFPDACANNIWNQVLILQGVGSAASMSEISRTTTTVVYSIPTANQVAGDTYQFHRIRGD